MVDSAKLLDLAEQCANGAAQILRDARRDGFGAVEAKSSSVDIVTETDRRSEDFVVATILAARPDDAILAEEGSSRPGTSGVEWVIDPLDGTVNFTYGIPTYSVSIGVVVDGVPTVGIVLNPALDETFIGVRGQGSTLNGRTLSVSSKDDLSTSLVATGFSYHSDRRKAEAVKLIEVLPAVRDIRRAGSASLDVCSVACGRVDAYFEHFVNPWDVMAAYVIATEAGAVVTGFDGGLPTNDIVAGRPGLHDQLLRLVTV